MSSAPLVEILFALLMLSIPLVISVWMECSHTFGTQASKASRTLQLIESKHFSESDFDEIVAASRRSPESAKMLYEKSLELVCQYRHSLTYRRLAIELGRVYYSKMSSNILESVHIEHAIDNDLRSCC